MYSTFALNIPNNIPLQQSQVNVITMLYKKCISMLHFKVGTVMEFVKFQH